MMQDEFESCEGGKVKVSRTYRLRTAFKTEATRLQRYNGSAFDVLGSAGTGMVKVRFPDGTVTDAYIDEIAY